MNLVYRVRCAECTFAKWRLFRQRAIHTAAAHQCLADHDDVIITGLP